ncbi:MAG: CDP-alcohol phosphatidyltransferase family protein [Acidobacteria bacterium]|nr:CDP-alcohol phosphatidyltransferase family protein [Acidobacteriota bacterium]
MLTQVLPVRSRRQEFPVASRIQQSLLAQIEKRALICWAERTPVWINPDHLTALGFTAQLLAGLCYLLSRSGRLWLLMAIGCLALNWFGDSMDGTLARVRKSERPRYGFYVDHMLDSIGAAALVLGLANSGYMSGPVATGLLVSFLLLSIQSYLAACVFGEFRMSFWSLGPTELRLLLAVGSLALFRWPMVFGGYRLFDVGGVIGTLGMAAMLGCFSLRNAVRLYREEAPIPAARPSDRLAQNHQSNGQKDG